MKLFTDAIDARGYFDSRYTCDLDNSSPELRWEDPPEGTVGFALIAEDPDAQAGTFAHWVVYEIPLKVLHLPAGIPPQDMLPNGIRQGSNGSNRLGYFGPCPPKGDTPHRYVFRLHALGAFPPLPARATRDQVLHAIAPYVLATAEVVGRYQRAMERAG